MNNLYLGEREFGLKVRTENEVGSTVWGGLTVLINNLIYKDYFGCEYPEMCPDNDGGILGTNKLNIKRDIEAFFPDIKFSLDASLDASDTPLTLTILELLEFCHERIAKPMHGYYHSFWGKHHLSFDVEAGQSEFRRKVNRIFERNGIAFELQNNGQITRLAPLILSNYLNTTVFKTGDTHLDSILETAIKKYLNPDLKIRLEALEKLWDAWERIKTLEYPSDKKTSITRLLEKASHESNMKERLDKDARELTEIGNHFMIRHTEIGKIPITSSAHVDYLFHRMFALIYLLLNNQVEAKAEFTTHQKSITAKSVEEEIQF